jgi:ubiquinone/menaquinone biosynthesis C-methylase UbiE
LATFNSKKAKIIVDMGCGTARVYQSFKDRTNLTFHNYDHVANHERGVIECDISRTPLDDGEADVVIMCLSMWGSNNEMYLDESHRILDPNGKLVLIEPTKRWMDPITGVNTLRCLIEMKKFVIEIESASAKDHQLPKFSMFVARKKIHQSFN